MNASETFNAVVGTIHNFQDSIYNYAGTLSINDNTYGLSFSSDGSGNAIVQVIGLSLPPGNYLAAVSVTDNVDSLVTSGSASFSITALSPLTPLSSMATNASVGVPWAGPIASFSDDPTFNQPTDFSTSTAYSSETLGAGNELVDGQSPWWTVNDAETFTTAGLVTANTTITDPAGRSTIATGLFRSVSRRSPSRL